MEMTGNRITVSACVLQNNLSLTRKAFKKPCQFSQFIFGVRNFKRFGFAISIAFKIFSLTLMFFPSLLDFFY